MLSYLFSAHTETVIPKEGDLYKLVDVQGTVFPIYYGYYADCERDNPAIDPMPIYPDFRKDPRYTPEGFAFVTKMQDACHHYAGSEKPEKDCAECLHYKHGDELLGICVCPHNQQLRNCERAKEETK